MFCIQLKLHAKACPSNAVMQTRGKNPLLAYLSIHGAVQWKPFQRGLHTPVLQGLIPLSHTSNLLYARISDFSLEEADKPLPL